MSRSSDLEQIILKTLSFYEKMDFSKIVLDIDTEEIKKYPDFSRLELEKILTKLQKKRMIKVSKEQDQLVFIRIHPPKTLKKWLFALFQKKL